MITSETDYEDYSLDASVHTTNQIRAENVQFVSDINCCYDLLDLDAQATSEVHPSNYFYYYVSLKRHPAIKLHVSYTGPFRSPHLFILLCSYQYFLTPCVQRRTCAWLLG